MKYITDGILAGFLLTLILSIWSIIVSMNGSVPDSSILDWVYFSCANIGMIGIPTIIFGIALGCFAEIWSRELGGHEGVDDDRVLSSRVATSMVLIPLMGILIAVLHLGVTSKFVRPTFQAAGLAILVILVGFFMFGIDPIVERGAQKILSKIGFKPEKFHYATRKLLFLCAILYAVGVVVGCIYGASLNLWDPQVLVMLGMVLLGVPASMWGMHRYRPAEMRMPLTVVVAVMIVTILFGVMAPYVTSRSLATRQWTTETPSIVGLQARIMRSIADGDRDGFASTWGGNDCNDADATIYPGAYDIPGDGIDQSCDGADEELIIDYLAPAMQRVERAISRGASAAQQVAEKVPEPPKNIVIILVDTLRMDHTGFGGYNRNTTPNLDALAAKSTVFTNAYATSPHTPRSIPAIFLSRYASKTKWKGAQYNYPRVLPENLSLFEVLHDDGWRTQGVSSHHYFEPKRGLDQGFDAWDNEGAKSISESNDDIAAPRTWAKLEPIIEEFGKDAKKPDAKPFAMFVHFFEPHARWIHHDQYPFEHDGSTESKHKANYDSEVRFVDDYVGKVLNKLEETGLAEKTIVVIVADHGEGFNEHGYYFHGQTLYNEAIHVPLVIHVPGWPGGRVTTPVSIIDIAPTILDLEKLKIPKDFQGESLVPLMLNGDGADRSSRPIFAELLPYTAWKEHHKVVVMGDTKLIHVLSKGTQELYDLKSDPGEKENLIEDKERAKPLQQALKGFMSSQ